MKGIRTKKANRFNDREAHNERSSSNANGKWQSKMTDGSTKICLSDENLIY